MNIDILLILVLVIAFGIIYYTESKSKDGYTYLRCIKEIANAGFLYKITDTPDVPSCYREAKARNMKYFSLSYGNECYGATSDLILQNYPKEDPSHCSYTCSFTPNSGIKTNVPTCGHGLYHSVYRIN
jgi:hypothetical protein